MQELDKFKGQEGKKYFQDQIGHGSDYSLSEVLWVCANLFSDVQFKMSHKRIMLFTNEDDPHGNDSAQASRARTKAGDLRDTGRYSGALNLQYMQEPQKSWDPLRCCVCSVALSCLTLCDPMDYNPPGSSVHGIS